MPKDMPTYTRPKYTEDDYSATAIRARISQFCEWFEVQPPKLRVRLGRVYLTDELTAWIKENGVSIDWLLVGDVKGLVALLRLITQKIADKDAEEAV